MQFFWLHKTPPIKDCKLLFEGSTLGKLIFYRGKENIADGMENIGGYVFETSTQNTPKLDRLMEYEIEDKKGSPFIRTIRQVTGPFKELHTAWVYLANENLRPDKFHKNSTIAV